MTQWQEAQKWEKNWWNTCINTYNEETKQFYYAKKMGLHQINDSKGSYFALDGKNILDIGGGPISLLLKCQNGKNCVVADPCDYPLWVESRYLSANIKFLKIAGENLEFDSIFDECWIYNVLQHVENPEKVIENAKRFGKIIRVFEWLETGISDGHIHNLSQINLDKWFVGEGKAVSANRLPPFDKTQEYFGVFKGYSYAG